jgi:hypothetical protein
MAKCPRCRDQEPKILESMKFNLRELMIKKKNKFSYSSYPKRWFKKLG